MNSRWCGLLSTEAATGLVHFEGTEELKKIDFCHRVELQCHNIGSGEDSFVNSMESFLTSMTSSKAPAIDNSPYELQIGPSARLLKRSPVHTSTRLYQIDTRPLSSITQSKRQRTDYNLSRSPSPARSESPELDTCHYLNDTSCNDPECNVPICRKPGCKDNDMIICNGDQCNLPAACRKDCFNRQHTPSNSPRRQWPSNELAKIDISNSRRLYTNNPTSYFGPPASPSPTTPLLSNDSSTIYSPQAEHHTPDGPISPKNSYQDLSEISFHNVEACFPQADESGRCNDTCNEIEQSWSSSGQYPEDIEKSFSFQCPWLDCSQIIQNGEEWNRHFHQEHIDPQMVYNCPLQSETCPESMATNPISHLQTDHGYDFSLNEYGYRCPSDACQQGMEYFDQMSFHDHLDLVHATPYSGQLQCRLWACGNWFDDPNQLVSHAMQNHTIPVWNRSVGEENSTSESCCPGPQVKDQTLINNQCNKKVQRIRDKKNLNHQLSLRLQESDNPTSNFPPLKIDSTSGLEKYTSHKCLWKDMHGITCEINFSSENDLQNHIKEIHLEILDNKSGYYCRWDGCMRGCKLGTKAGFSQRGKLERHMATHTNFKCSSCDICGASFSAPQAMRQHRRLHTGERPWKCQHCDKTFTQQSACTVHERTHTNEKPLECPICFKRFSESSNLTKHRKTHGEKGAHVCTVASCGKSFHRFDQLKRHLLTHLS